MQPLLPKFALLLVLLLLLLLLLLLRLWWARERRMPWPVGGVVSSLHGGRQSQPERGGDEPDVDVREALIAALSFLLEVRAGPYQVHNVAIVVAAVSALALVAGVYLGLLVV